MRSRLSTVLALLAIGPGASPLTAQGGVQASNAYTGPIIDMHLHAGDAEFPARPAPNPTTRQPSVRTAGEHMDRSLEIMRRHRARRRLRREGGEGGEFLACPRTRQSPARNRP